MIKHILALIVLTLIVIFSISYAQTAFHFLITAHDWISESLTSVFNGGKAGNISRELIASLAIPLLAGLIPAGIYWLAKRSWFPGFMTFVWVTWLVQTSILIITYKMVG